MSLLLFTNGTMFRPEMLPDFVRLRIHVVISHDGASSTEIRGRDPLREQKTLASIREVFNALNPLGLISFNATINKKNISPLRVRRNIALMLGVHPRSLHVTQDLVTPYDSHTMSFVARTPQEQAKVRQELFTELAHAAPMDLRAGDLTKPLGDFMRSLVQRRSSKVLGQKCGMDSPKSLAVDLDGNALTCQNTVASGGHKIGTIEDYDGIRLHTSYHWSKRSECGRCPVLQLCKGSCMFLKDELWEAACDQMFTWNLVYMALGLYHLTGRVLIAIESPVIRRTTEPQCIPVIDYPQFLKESDACLAQHG